MEVKKDPEYGHGVNQSVIDIIKENDLTQVVKEPTGLAELLDIVCTTNPDLVKSIETHEGINDHRIFITEINIKVSLAKKKPQNVYKKGDMGSKKADLKSIQQEIELDSRTKTVETLWSTLT
eukprot:gene15388-6624_t